MNREFERHTGTEHSVRILHINEESPPRHEDLCFQVHNIGKGGFRFEADLDLQLEDRVRVQLCFPDGHQQPVLGRICYRDELGDGRAAYGFSVIEGFYSLRRP